MAGVDRTSQATIFVALAAYREPELAATIESCVRQAAHPERLRFGVCLQYDETIAGAERGCIDHLLDAASIRMLVYPHTASRGGCWARHRAQALYEGEDYTLQCDAHSRLEPNWDVDLIELVDDLPSDKPLITGFPPLYGIEDGVEVFHGSADDPVPMTLVERWSPEGWIHHPTVAGPETGTREPRRTRVISGAFVFTLGQWNIEVRQDPEHLYTGEEFALTLRSFTHGYEFWNPPHRVIWHRVHPTANPKYISDDPDGRQQRRHLRAMSRLRTLLAGDPDMILEPYTLGSACTLDDYHRFSGLDCVACTIHPDAQAGVPPDPITVEE